MQRRTVKQGLLNTVNCNFRMSSPGAHAVACPKSGSGSCIWTTPGTRGSVENEPCSRSCKSRNVKWLRWRKHPGTSQSHPFKGHRQAKKAILWRETGRFSSSLFDTLILTIASVSFGFGVSRSQCQWPFPFMADRTSSVSCRFQPFKSVALGCLSVLINVTYCLY